MSNANPNHDPPRQPPHQRAKHPPAMREGDNDRRIVELVYHYRLLSQQQVERLLGRSKPTVQRLLRRLYDHHYLERLFLPVTAFGSSPCLYILDKQGIALLQRMGIEDWVGIPTKHLSPMFMAHALAINEVRIALELACQVQGYTISRWLGENDLKADYDRVRISGQPQPISLVPDSFFTLEVPDKGTAHFFLELDRGTMTVKRFREKVAAYVAYYTSGGYTQRYGAKGFRVLTVVEGVGQRRLESLLQTTQTVSSIGRRFWFAHQSEITPDTVLSAPIWRVAGDDQPIRLLEL